MIEFRTITGKTATDALGSPESAETFWSTLPHGEPLALQRRLCDEIARGAGWEQPDVHRFRALRHLDRRVDRVLEGFLSEYAALGGQSPDIERAASLAAAEVCRAFGQEYDRYFRVAASVSASAAWKERLPELVVRLFRHRDVESTLALCRYERWAPARWKATHETFRHILASGAARRRVGVRQRSDKTIVSMTPEQAYVRILLLQLLDSGRFRSEEILSVRRHVARWSATLRLEASDLGASGGSLRVDLSGADGLTRSLPSNAGETLWLDTSFVADAIDGLIAEHVRVASVGASGTPVDRQLDLLARLKDLYAAQHAKVSRRGERTVAPFMSVEATLGGLHTVFRTLRDEARRLTAAADNAQSVAEEITIGDVGASPQGATPPAPSPFGADAEGDGNECSYSLWQVRDHSESGSRLRGRAREGRLPKPGSLLAFRDDKFAPWTVAIVRRLSRIIGGNVELGVEYLGRNPQAVTLMPEALSPDAGAQDERPDQIAAICLPQSEARPGRPVDSLILPACEFASGRLLVMRSATNDTGIRLKDPLERDADFVWTTFEPVPAPARGERPAAH
jgi:hypothetical protein